MLGEKTQRDRRKAMILEIAAQQTEATLPGSGTQERKVYPYSIIEGGAATVDELKRAIANDPVVAEHFKNFDLSKTRVETLTQPRIAHVSYRNGDDVFWTKKAVRIPAGEKVLTDGTNMARTRCGNCLSTAPAAPVSDAEPAAHVLDTPELVPAFRRTSLPTGGITVPPGPDGPVGSIASNPPGGSPRATPSAGPLPPGRGDTPGSSSGPAGPASSASDEVADGPDDPGDPADPDLTWGGEGSGNRGNPGSPGDPGNPGNPPGNPPGPPNGPSPMFVPPAGGDPGDPPLPPLPSFVPPGDDPFNPPGDPAFTPPTVLKTTQGDPGGPGGPEDPGNPGNPIQTTQTETIPEPGTTALMLLAGAYAARRLRRRS